MSDAFQTMQPASHPRVFRPMSSLDFSIFWVMLFLLVGTMALQLLNVPPEKFAAKLSSMGIFLLLVSVASFVVVRLAAAARFIVTDHTIAYASGLPAFLQSWSPAWSMRWDEIEHAYWGNSRGGAREIFVTSPGQTRKILVAMWFENKAQIAGWKEIMFNTVLTRSENLDLSLLPMVELFVARGKLTSAIRVGEKQKMFDLAKHIPTRTALLVAAGLMTYWLIDVVFSDLMFGAFVPWLVMAAMGVIGWVSVAHYLIGQRAPRMEGVFVGFLTGTALLLVSYTGLQRLGQALDPAGTEIMLTWSADKQLTPDSPAARDLAHLSERSRKYWQTQQTGSNHTFLQHHALGYIVYDLSAYRARRDKHFGRS